MLFLSKTLAPTMMPFFQAAVEETCQCECVLSGHSGSFLAVAIVVAFFLGAATTALICRRGTSSDREGGDSSIDWEDDSADFCSLASSASCSSDEGFELTYSVFNVHLAPSFARTSVYHDDPKCGQFKSKAPQYSLRLCQSCGKKQ